MPLLDLTALPQQVLLTRLSMIFFFLTHFIELSATEELRLRPTDTKNCFNVYYVLKKDINHCLVIHFEMFWYKHLMSAVVLLSGGKNWNKEEQLMNLLFQGRRCRTHRKLYL